MRKNIMMSMGGSFLAEVNFKTFIIKNNCTKYGKEKP